MSDRMTEAFHTVIRAIGEDPAREGLVKTPHRAAEAFRHFTRGYDQTIEGVLNGAVFTDSYEEMVLVKDIEFYSLCEHHLLPFFGHAQVAYLPAGKLIGLSKIARLVDMFSRRLQVQERMTDQIAHAIEEAINPRGVAVVVEAQHLCMMSRGVEKQNAMMVTSCVLGEFRENRATRQEFLDLLRK